jgi:hypothetical protein
MRSSRTGMLRVSEADGCAERDTATEMLGERVAGRATVGQGREYHTGDFTPPVANSEHAERRRSAGHALGRGSRARSQPAM